MRKFRVYDNILKKYARFAFMDADGFVYKDADPNGIQMSGKRSIYPFIDATVEFSIGQTDAWQKDVYDGDIIRIQWTNGDVTDHPISYDPDYGYWMFSNNPICELNHPEIRFSVIGNIHELTKTEP